MKPLLLTFVLLSLAVPLHAQSSPSQDAVPPVATTVSLSGPRFGFTALSDGIVTKLKEQDIVVKNGISQFGWQFEHEFYNQGGDGLKMLNEWVVLVGGLDQGVVLPSVSWLVGLRAHGGAEFGIGPNVTPAGVALVFAAGATFRAGVMNIPLNLAVVPSKDGTRVSVLTGFTLR